MHQSEEGKAQAIHLLARLHEAVMDPEQDAQLGVVS